MRLNQFIFFVASTMIVGTLVGVITSVLGLWVHVAWFTGLIEGGFLATNALMGFWAYLTLNFIARVTLPKRVWRWAQALVVLLVLYDMLWSRYHLDFARNPVHHAAFTTYFVQGIWPFAVALVAAYFKQRLSGKGSFLPTVFYLYVFTVVDWLLVLRAHSDSLVNQTGIIMVACNVYMILVFGKLLSPRNTEAGENSTDTDPIGRAQPTG